MYGSLFLILFVSLPYPNSRDKMISSKDEDIRLTISSRFRGPLHRDNMFITGISTAEVSFFKLELVMVIYLSFLT